MSYRDKLIAMVRAVGKDLAEHPENYVPMADLMTDFDIDIRFDCNGSIPMSRINISSEHLSVEGRKLLMNNFEEENSNGNSAD